MGLESQVATLKEDKAKLLEDILEAERQVLMWEKKIALERETQAALDPTVRCMGGVHGWDAWAGCLPQASPLWCWC